MEGDGSRTVPSGTAPRPVSKEDWKDAMDMATEAGLELPKDMKRDAMREAQGDGLGELQQQQGIKEHSAPPIYVHPLKFDIVMSPEKSQECASFTEVAKVIGGQDEKQFTNLITSISGDKESASAQLGAGAGFVDEGKMDKEQLKAAVQGTAYMQAEDAEDKKIELKEAEKRARDTAMDEAAEIKAAGIMKANTDKKQAAIQHVEVDQAKRDRDIKAEKASEQAVGKGWLSPKLGGELVMQQKKKVAADQAQLRADRTKERNLKLRSRMTANEYKRHTNKHEQAVLGEATARQENAKEMAMKFVGEMERRQKSAFQEKLKDAENKKNMLMQAEVAAKKNAMHE